MQNLKNRTSTVSDVIIPLDLRLKGLKMDLLKYSFQRDCRDHPDLFELQFHKLTGLDDASWMRA